MQSFNLTQTLAHLRLDVPSFRPVARAYLHDVMEYLEAMDQAHACREYATIAQSAQAMTRVANVIHADELAHLASELATLADAGDADGVGRSLRQLHLANLRITNTLRMITDDE